MSFNSKTSAVPVVGIVGHIIPVDGSPIVDWKIKHFFTNLELVNSVDSPPFYFKNIPMKIKLFHRSKKHSKDVVKWFELCILNAEDMTSMVSLIRKIGIRRNDGFVYKVVELQGERHGVYLLPVWEFLKYRDDLATVEGHVTFFLEFQLDDKTRNTSTDEAIFSVDGELPSTVPVSEELPPYVSGEFSSSSSIVSDCTGRSAGLDKLSNNYRDMYLNEKYCDLTVQVDERQFKTHKAVLCARSPVLEKEVDEMVKSGTNALTVTICKPEIFHVFLLYLYSGSETLADSNVVGLYNVSREYGVEDLQEYCVDYMKSNLSLDLFCDVIVLATKHNEAELLELSKEYFVRNTKRILLSKKWQSLLKDNSMLANDLFLLTVPDD